MTINTPDTGIKNGPKAETLLEVLIALALTLFVALGDGILLSFLWHLFFAPTFGIPDLSIPQAIGISLTVSVLTDTETSKRIDNVTFMEGIRYFFGQAVKKYIAATTAALIIAFFL